MKKNLILGALALLFLFTGFNLNAQKLEDFEDCADKTFTECIPFPSIYSEAAAIGKEVAARKTIPSSLGVNLLVSQHENLMDELGKLNEKLKLEQKNQADWKKAHPTGPNAYDKPVADAEKKIAEQDKKIKTHYAKLEEGKEAYRRLYEARAALREEFDKVKVKLDYAKGHPKEYIEESSYKSSDKAASDKKLSELTKELNGYIDKIKNHIVSQEAGHRREEDAAKKGMDTLDDLLR